LLTDVVDVDWACSLLDAFRTLDQQVLTSLVESLIETGISEESAQLVEAVVDITRPFRWQQVEGVTKLIQIDDPRVAPLLISLLAHENESVRYHSAETLGKMGDRRALEELQRMAGKDTGRTFFGRPISEIAQEAITSITSSTQDKGE